MGEGYRLLVGLVYVDYATQALVLKISAHWFAGIIAANALPVPPPTYSPGGESTRVRLATDRR